MDGEARHPRPDRPRNVCPSISCPHNGAPCADPIRKYTTFYLDRAEGQWDGIRVNFSGNSRKTLNMTVERSLKKLRTTYIDLLYVHWWDYTTSIPEVMNALNDLVKAGKVLYLGVSDTPAWIVAHANDYARQHGLTPFSV